MMEKTTKCAICGDTIVVSPPQDNVGGRGSMEGKRGAVHYIDGEKEYVCQSHLFF